MNALTTIPFMLVQRTPFFVFVYWINTLHYLSSLYWVTTPLHVSVPFVAHHHEVECIYVANGTYCTSKSSVGGSGWTGTFHPDSPTDVLEVKPVPFATYIQGVRKRIPYFYCFSRCPACGEWCKLDWLLLDTPSFDWNTRRSRGHKIFKLTPKVALNCDNRRLCVFHSTKCLLFVWWAPSWKFCAYGDGGYFNKK
jgi:hypothetical protein